MASNLESTLHALAGEELKLLLHKEGKKIEGIAKEIWQKYLDSYTPVEYIRTGKSMRSIQLSSVKKISATEYGIELMFADDLAYHDSWLYQKGFTKKNIQGHSIMLISEGWHSSKLEEKYGRKFYRHTYYEGFHYMDKLLKAYKAVKSPLIIVEHEWTGNFTRKG